MNAKWLEQYLQGIRPYSKEYYVVKRVVEGWGYWKPKPKGGSFKPGYDPRRKNLNEEYASE